MIEVNYFWIGAKLSQMEQLALKSCFATGNKPVLWTYDTISNVPDYVIVKDARKILPEVRFIYFLNELKLPLAVISDIFRIHLLHLLGGLYSDTDIVILKNLSELPLDKEFFCTTFEYEWGECSSNCFMNVFADSEISNFLMKECDNRLEEIIRTGVTKENYVFLGPSLTEECRRKVSIKLLPYDLINPISWRWVDKAIVFRRFPLKFFLKRKFRGLHPSRKVQGYRLTKSTVALHLCNEMWKRKGLEKDSSYNYFSLYEKMKRLYSV